MFKLFRLGLATPAGTGRRPLGLRPWIEVVPEETKEESIRRVVRLAKSLGYLLAVVRRPYDGHVRRFSARGKKKRRITLDIQISKLAI